MKLVIFLCLSTAAVLVSGANKTENELCKTEIKCTQTEYKEYVKCLGKRRAKRQTCNGQYNSIVPQIVQPVPLQPCSGPNCNNCLNDCTGSCSGNNCASRCDRSCQTGIVPPIQTIVQPNPPVIVEPIRIVVPPNPPQIVPPIKTIVPPNPPQIVPPIITAVKPTEKIVIVDPLPYVRPPRVVETQNSVYNSSSIIQEKTREISSSSPNVTTIIKLTNIVNNTNIVNVPTNINNTNINNLDLGTNVTSGSEGRLESLKEDLQEKPDTQKCCVVVQPRVCEKINSSKGGVRCVHRKHHTCGDECTSDTLHAQVRQPCNGPPESCPPQVAYVPQPQPRCSYQPSWPYVSCGNKPSSCGGCYDHYGYGFQQYYGAQKPSCGGCYDDGHQPGSLYRQGPYYQPGYYHMPPVNYVAQPSAMTACGSSGCFGNERIDPVFGAPSFSPYGALPFYPQIPQYYPQNYMPQALPQYMQQPSNLLQPMNANIAFSPTVDASMSQQFSQADLMQSGQFSQAGIMQQSQFPQVDTLLPGQFSHSGNMQFPQGDSMQSAQYPPWQQYPQYPMMSQPCFMPPYYQPQPCPAPFPSPLPMFLPFPNGSPPAMDNSFVTNNGTIPRPWLRASRATPPAIASPLMPKNNTQTDLKIRKK